MVLQTTWFILIFVLLGGYALLDGFDLGVGVLHLFARNDTERRVSINSIAPVWDGNEVWLLAGGGALFAAFPPVYATVFSGFYLALMLLLVALIFRAVSMEFRGKVDSPRWRRVWDYGFAIGSLLPPLLLGTALGNVLRGVPLSNDGEFAGTFLGLLNPYSLLVGVFALVMFTTHGAIYLANKTDGEHQARIIALIKPLWMALVAVHILAALATMRMSSHLMAELAYRLPISIPLMLLLSASLIYLPIAAFVRRDYRHAFAASSGVIVGMVGLTATSLFPVLLNNDAGAPLSAFNSSSTQRTLTVMLIIALIGMPLVLAYTIAIYRSFKGKVVLTEESY
jgi:cytochrome d ubiquinol oxidase subunit II